MSARSSPAAPLQAETGPCGSFAAVTSSKGSWWWILVTCVACASAPPAREPSPKPLPAQCPEWTGSDEGAAVHVSNPLDWATTRRTLERLQSEGRLLEARALAAQTAARCKAAPGSLTNADASALKHSFEVLRADLKAPKSGDEYVQLARAGRSDAEVRAAWSRAYLAYARETRSSARMTALLPVSRAWVKSRDRICPRGVRTQPEPAMTHRIWRLAGSQDLLWRIGAAGRSPPLFEGVVDDLEMVGTDAWLVQRQDQPLELHTSAGPLRRLEASTGVCASSVHVVGSWLLWSGTDAALHFLGLTGDSFELSPPGDGAVQVDAVGRYLLVSRSTDDDRVPLVVLRIDGPGRPRQVWAASAGESWSDATLYDLPRWGGVLAFRQMHPQPKAQLGFEWSVRALQVETGKPLAQLTTPADYEVSPRLTVSPRYGLIAVGAAGDTRVAPLGHGRARRVAFKHLEGQVDELAVADDGLVCANSIIMGRDVSCALTPLADLSGAQRQKDDHRVCLHAGARVYSSTLRARPGRVLVPSRGHTAMYWVCAERLSPDGSSAAFLEAKSRTDEEPFTDVKLLLVDTRASGKRREIAIEGNEEPMYSFIDLGYSPDGRYLSLTFDHHVQLYRASDGAVVSARAKVRRRLGPEWLDDTTLSSGGDLGPLLTLKADRFTEDPGRALRWLSLSDGNHFALQSGERRTLWDSRTGKPLPTQPLPAKISDESAPPLLLHNPRKQDVWLEPITPGQVLAFFDDGAMEVLGDPLSAAGSAALRCRFGSRLVPGEVCRDIRLLHGVYRERFGYGLQR